MASEAFQKNCRALKKKKSRQEKKQNSKEAFNLERSAVPTKDCKKLNRECGSEAGTGTATKPKAEPARGQHWLLLSPLARVRDPPPKEARSAGGDLGRPAVSVSLAGASRGPAGAGNRCSPDPANQRRSFPAAQPGLEPWKDLQTTLAFRCLATKLHGGVCSGGKI